LDGLWGRIARLADYEPLGSRGVAEVACEFDALCAGLVALELQRLLSETTIVYLINRWHTAFSLRVQCTTNLTDEQWATLWQFMGPRDTAHDSLEKTRATP
jgi:hypothetical protein